MDHKVPVNPDWPRKKTPESSLIEEVVYNPAAQTLYVHFKTNDSVYSYIPVSAGQWKTMYDAPSSSGYFVKHIKGNKKIKYKSI